MKCKGCGCLFFSDPLPSDYCPMCKLTEKVKAEMEFMDFQKEVMTRLHHAGIKFQVV